MEDAAQSRIQGPDSAVRRARRGAALALALALGAVGCNRFSYSEMPVAKGSAQSGDGHSVTMRGQALNLAGHEIKVGDPLGDVQLTGPDLAPVKLAAGKVRIISVVPSIDTKVCEQQTHYLSEKNNGLDKSIQLVTVSVDTPFAQGRFAREAKIDNVTFLSDYRDAQFGKDHGLLVAGPHLLARAVLVVDAQNVIQYLQVTPELSELPDMEAAFQAARKLVKS